MTTRCGRCRTFPSIPSTWGGRYEAVIRVNSQSGKGGVAFIMKAEHGFDLPRRLQIEFSKTIQAITEDSGTEISPAAMWEAFRARYLPEPAPYELLDHELVSEGARGPHPPDRAAHGARTPRTVTGTGNGPIAAFVDGLRRRAGVDFDVVDYAEHALGQGADATAVAYVETAHGADSTLRWGVGVHPNIITASLMAVLSGLAGGQGRVGRPAPERSADPTGAGSERPRRLSAASAADDHHRAARVGRHRARDRAEQRGAEPASPVGAHDDEVVVAGARRLARWSRPAAPASHSTCGSRRSRR